MKRLNSRTILFIFTLLPLSLFSQNLLKNSSFEEFYFCPSNYTEDNSKTFLPGWSMPTKGTPDYFNKCSQEMVGVPQNFMGIIHAFDGFGYVGMVLLDSPEDVKKTTNYREYIQAKLTVPLQRDELYLVKFYYTVANYSTFVTNKLGVCLTQSKISENRGVIKAKPQLFIDTSAIYFKPSEWVQFADTFKAYGGEVYFTLGNFCNDSKTQYVLNDFSMYPTNLQNKILTNQISYYYFDNISVEKISKTEYVNEYGFIQKFKLLSHYPLSDLYKNLGSETVYLLDETYFDIQNNEQKPMSFYQTDSLITFFRKNPNLNLSLIGLWHENEKDSLGAFSRTESLSDLMVMKGINSNRLSVKTENIKSLPKSVRSFNSGKKSILFTNLVALRIIHN